MKSEGAVSEHQSNVLGVYRMVDSYNDRPVYKQDGGENYIYYRYHTGVSFNAEFSCGFHSSLVLY